MWNKQQSCQRSTHSIEEVRTAVACAFNFTMKGCELAAVAAAF
jgi:hypothetical protein